MKQITLLAAEGRISSSISYQIDAFAVANLWNHALSGGEENLFETKVITPHPGKRG